MSTEEQDQILGRLMRESRDSRRRIAALNAKLQDFRSQFRDVTTAFTGFDTPGALQRAIAATQQMPDRSVVFGTLEELRLEQERLRETELHLSAFAV
jgi:hypothetical protein